MRLPRSDYVFGRAGSPLHAENAAPTGVVALPEDPRLTQPPLQFFGRRSINNGVFYTPKPRRQPLVTDRYVPDARSRQLEDKTRKEAGRKAYLTRGKPLHEHPSVNCCLLRSLLDRRFLKIFDGVSNGSKTIYSP